MRCPGPTGLPPQIEWLVRWPLQKRTPCEACQCHSQLAVAACGILQLVAVAVSGQAILVREGRSAGAGAGAGTGYWLVWYQWLVPVAWLTVHRVEFARPYACVRASMVLSLSGLLLRFVFQLCAVRGPWLVLVE